jgi:hypothetical protein
MADIDWSKAPEWADRLIRMSTTNRLAWACRNKYQYIDGAESFLFSDAPTDGFMLNQTVFVEGRPTTQPAAWNGDGLPPVGAVCEYMWDYKQEGSFYVQVEVLAHDKGSAILRALSGPKTGELRESRGGVCGPRNGQAIFRPIRTPEQIAADERSKYCDRIFGVLTNATRAGNRSDMAEALYDAGLRFKDEAK